MDRFSGWTRGPMVAALMVLSTGACAQRVASPPPVAAPAPVVQAPVAPPPGAESAARALAPKPVSPPRPVAEAPDPEPPIVRQKIAEAPTPAEREQKREPTRNEAPVTPKPELSAPAELGAQYQVAEVASADYGSAVTENPTPDTALDIAALSTPDTPPEPPVAKAPPAPPSPVAPAALPDTPPVPEVVEEDPAYEPLSALATLFGNPKPEETPVVAESAEPEAVAPQAAEDETAEAEENPYPGGFDDEQAYQTAQLAQSPYAYEAPAPTPAYDPNAPVTVAILTPDTDSRASIRTLAKGLAQAAALSARTLGNRQLVLRGYDTGGTPEKAQIAAQQALADGAQLIIGPLFSSSASAVAPLAQGAGVPVIAFTTDRAVLRRGLYSVGYLPDAEIDRMLSFAAKRGISKIGLLSPDTPYGGIVFRTVQDTAPGYGINVATVQPISQNFAQAAETGQRFADFYKTNPDTTGVLIATNGKPLQGIAAYLAYNDVLPSKVQYMGLGTWDDSETFREATLRGGWFPGLDPTLKADFETRYQGAYGAKPPAIAALAYDGVAIAGALLQRSQSTGQPPFTTRNIETPTGFRGMSGLFRFLPDGRNQRLLSILKVGRRQFEMLDPAPTAFSQRLTSITGYSQ